MADSVAATIAHARALARAAVANAPTPRLAGVSGDDLSFMVVQLRRAEPTRLHVHDEHDEVMVVLDGSATFRLADRSDTAEVGDVLHAPAGVAHAVEPTDACVLLAVFGPGMDPDHPDRRFLD
jgi:quercetin dioxygenase-like cupin family protein